MYIYIYIYINRSTLTHNPFAENLEVIPCPRLITYHSSCLSESKETDFESNKRIEDTLK